MKKILLFILILFAFILGFSFDSHRSSYERRSFNNHPTPKPSITPIPTLSPNEFKNELRDLINKYRIENGTQLLKENSLLDKSAQLKLNDLIRKAYWAHESPDGVEPWYFIKTAGYNYQSAGENLAKEFTNPEEIFNAWMNSSTHRENIEATKFTEDGMAVSYQPGGFVYVVHHMAAPLRTTPEPKLYNTNEQETINRSGEIITYHEWCTNKNINIYKNELITQKSSDGKVYTMTQGDWDCFEGYLQRN